VFDGEGGVGRDGDALAGDLDAERFAAFDAVGPAAELGGKLGEGIGLFDVPVAAFFAFGHDVYLSI
jgi:hypothetical protein